MARVALSLEQIRSIAINPVFSRMSSSLDQYTRICSLGRGSYGSIFKVRRNADGLVCVIKQVRPQHGRICDDRYDRCAPSTPDCVMQIPLSGLSQAELSESVNEARVMSRIA